MRLSWGARRSLARAAAVLLTAAAGMAGVTPMAATRVAAAPAQACPADLTAWRTALGAEWIDCHVVADLTTTGNSFTDHGSTTGYGYPPPGAGPLESKETTPTSPAVPGIQVDGYFHDGCNAFVPEPTTFIPGCTPAVAVGNVCATNCHHDAAFVIRIPDAWNGHLLTGGTGGIRDQFSDDFVFSDFALEKGWAYVSQDKGNMGSNFFQGGCDEVGVSCGTTAAWPGAACPETPGAWCPGAAIAEWTFRIRQATSAARQLLTLVGPLYSHPSGVNFSYVTGISNGGYQTRRALETDSPTDQFGVLYDGGVDWEGTLLIPTLPAGVQRASASTGWILFNYLPTALQTDPDVCLPNPSAATLAAMAAVGFNPASYPLWTYHCAIYWALTQKVYRLEFDPEASAYSDCVPGVVAGPCVAPPALPESPLSPDNVDNRYDYSARLAANPSLATRIGRAANSGNIQRPMITLHGDHDALLPIKTDSDLYAQMVHNQGRDPIFRYYTVQGGNHVDSLFDDHQQDDYGKNVLRPILPCTRASIEAMAAWVEKGAAPPPTHTIPRPQGASASDLANKCDIAATAAATNLTGTGTAPAGPTSNRRIGSALGGTPNTGTAPYSALLPATLAAAGFTILVSLRRRSRRARKVTDIRGTSREERSA